MQEKKLPGNCKSETQGDAAKTVSLFGKFASSLFIQIFSLWRYR